MSVVDGRVIREFVMEAEWGDFPLAQMELPQIEGGFGIEGSFTYLENSLAPLLKRTKVNQEDWECMKNATVNVVRSSLRKSPMLIPVLLHADPEREQAEVITRILAEYFRCRLPGVSVGADEILWGIINLVNYYRSQKGKQEVQILAGSSCGGSYSPQG